MKIRYYLVLSSIAGTVQAFHMDEKPQSALALPQDTFVMPNPTQENSGAPAIQSSLAAPVAPAAFTPPAPPVQPPVQPASSPASFAASSLPSPESFTPPVVPTSMPTPLGQSVQSAPSVPLESEESQNHPFTPSPVLSEQKPFEGQEPDVLPMPEQNSFSPSPFIAHQPMQQFVSSEPLPASNNSFTPAPNVAATTVASMPTFEQAKPDADAKNADEHLQLNVDVSSVVDLDTFSLQGSGNWLEKRIWYEKAEQLFSKLRGVVAQVVDIRDTFLTSSRVAFEKINAFYPTVGVGIGNLEERINSAVQSLEQIAKNQKIVTEQEKQHQQKALQSQQEMKQFSKGLKFLEELENRLDETMQQAFKAVADARLYETKAWDNFVAIAKEIDDKKARSLYYEMESFEKNVLERKVYLEQKLLPYMQNELIQRAERSMIKIQNLLKSLQAKGIDLSKDVAQDIALKEQELQAQVKKTEQALADEQKREMQEQKASAAKKSTAAAVWDTISTKVTQAWCGVQEFFCSIGSYFSLLFSKKTGK